MQANDNFSVRCCLFSSASVSRAKQQQAVVEARMHLDANEARAARAQIALLMTT